MSTARAEVYLVAMARTPFGRFQGMLAGMEPRDFAVRALDAAVGRLGAEVPVDALYCGIGLLAGGALTYVRQMLLTSATLPETIPSLAVDRACCSGMSAIGLAFRDIRLGEAEVVVAGGFDGLSRMPLLAERNPTTRPGERTLADPLLLRTPLLDRSIAQYTSDEALARGIDRVAQDEWAVRSHALYFAEHDRGGFADERIAVGDETSMPGDEGPRRSCSAERLILLPTVGGTRTITAGNAPALSDGAAFVALASKRAVGTYGLRPIAEICDYVQVAGGATSGSYTPALAIERLIYRNGLTRDGLDAIEINEAFAATPPVSLLRLNDMDSAAAARMAERTNRRGGAVALGHPLGASGARIVMSAAVSLRQRGGGTAAAAICGGFGQGDALLLKA